MSSLRFYVSKILILKVKWVNFLFSFATKDLEWNTLT